MTQSFNNNRYDEMTYRRCGRSGLVLPAISLGAWETFGGYRDATVGQECLFRAFDLGITHFDLANNYGVPPGNAERVTGAILKQMPRDELIVSTKAGYRMWPGPYGEWLSKKSLVASLDQSLKRLQLDYVDIYYAHRPDPDTPLEETLAALDLIVRQGKALYVGVSNFPGAHFCDAVRIADRNGWTPITIHQPYYNLLGRTIESDLLDHTERHGCGVIPFSPLAQGLLTDKYLDGIPDDSRAALHWNDENYKNHVTPERIEAVGELNRIAASRGQTLAQMALAWTIRDSRITSVLIGASKVSQIEENVKALRNMEFTAEELEKIDRITDPGGKAFRKP